MGQQDYDGEVWHKQDLRVGYMKQEPELMEKATVWDNIQAGIQEKTQLLERFEQVGDFAKLGGGLQRLRAWIGALLSRGPNNPQEDIPEQRRVRPPRAALRDGQREAPGMGMGVVLRHRDAVAPTSRHRPSGRCAWE